jgi:hypothetical protein
MRRRGVHSRMGSTVVFGCHRIGKHLFLDGVITTIYKNNCRRSTSTVPGYAAISKPKTRSWTHTKSLRRQSLVLMAGNMFWCPMLCRMEDT